MSKDLPQGWEEKELSEISDYITEKIEVNNLTLDNYISTENMNPNIGGVERASSLPNIGKVNEFKKEDILFSNIRTYFKKIWFATFDGGSSTDVLTIRKKDKEFCSKYLYYALTTENYFDYTVKTSKGTKMPRGDKNAIMQYKIKFPSDINEQKRIANILTTFDNKIEINNQINQTLEEMATTLFKEWFENFNFPNSDGKPYKDNGGEMKSSELGEIPIDWEVSYLKNISNIIMGQSPKGISYNEENIGVPLINGASDFEGTLPKPKKYTISPTKISEKDDIVFGIRATIGNVVFIDKGYCLGRGVAAVRVEKELLEFVFLLLKKEIDNLAQTATGSVFANLTKNDLENLKILLPRLSVLYEYSKKIKPLFEKIKANHEENQILKIQRDKLLPKLMSGEKRV